MSIDIRSTLESLFNARASQGDDIAALLEFVPQAAFLADLPSHSIILANAKLAELTSFTRAELRGLSIQQMFPEWEKSTEISDQMVYDDPATRRLQVQQLIKRNQGKMQVRIMPVPLSQKGKRVFILFDLNDLSGQSSVEIQSYEQFWKSLQTLLLTHQEPDFHLALSQVLQSGKDITGADYLAIYQAQHQMPHLTKVSSLEAAIKLPDQLPAQDLIQSNKLDVWTAGRRPATTLHRTARSAHFSYLISAPIGEPHALIGLVAIAGSDPDSYNISRQAAEVLAIVVNSLYQEHAWAIKNRSELQAQQYEHCINATIEQHMREGAILVSPSMHILRLNVAAEAILGYSNRQVVRQPVEKILIGTETLLPALDTAQSGSATNNLENLRLFRRNGESFLATVRVYPVINGDQVQAILVLVQDLSEQEQYRMQTQHLEQRAILGEITAIFAHEIRNPINNISTGLQVLAMNLPEGDQNQESIDRLLQDCDRLNDLIKSVLASSKPMDYEMETLDMPAVLNRLLENLKPRFSRLNIEHSLQVEPNCPQIKGNLRALEQVFTNLINNALQQMSEKGGNLTVKIQSTGEPDGKEFLEVSIADTGPGIPKEEQEKIFQPFFTTKRDGTGLGLAIVKRIVSAHNGNVGVTSVPGGTAFHVRFPVTCE